MQPKNQKQAVLRLLIDNQFMTPVKFVRNGLLSYHQRISELRNLLHIKCEEVTFKNKFGHTGTYGKWSIPNKSKAEKIYRQLWKESHK